MAQEKLIDYTFSSGVKVKIKKISPYLLQEISKKYPEPKPPTRQVEIMGIPTDEENTSDPTYLEELVKYNAEQEERVRTFLMKHGVVYDLTDDDRAELSNVKENLKKEFDIDIDVEDEKVAFLTFVAVADAKDVSDLIEKIIGRVQPTESQVREAQSNFPRPLRK